MVQVYFSLMKELAHKHWENEDHFTDWIAGKRKGPEFEADVPNITYLESALEFYITESEAQVDIGGYSLDNRIEGVDANDTYTAVIENQFQLRRSKPALTFMQTPTVCLWTGCRHRGLDTRRVTFGQASSDTRMAQ
jgi:hypothetical protein